MHAQPRSHNRHGPLIHWHKKKLFPMETRNCKQILCHSSATNEIAEPLNNRYRWESTLRQGIYEEKRKENIKPWILISRSYKSNWINKKRTSQTIMDYQKHPCYINLAENEYIGSRSSRHYLYVMRPSTLEARTDKN